VDGMLITAGALTGLVVGLTGVGGGALMTPLLLLGFGVAPLTAVGTDLWFAAITKLFATKVHHGHGLIDWQVVKRLWIGSLTASAATLVWMRLQPVDASAVTLLKTAIAAAVLLTAVGLIFQKQLHALGHRLRTTDAAHFKAVQPALTVLAGAVLGVLFGRPVPAALNAAQTDCNRHSARHTAGYVCRPGAFMDRQCRHCAAGPTAGGFYPWCDSGGHAVGSFASWCVARCVVSGAAVGRCKTGMERVGQLN
jgi:uncharacterized membrane protein YfcA